MKRSALYSLGIIIVNLFVISACDYDYSEYNRKQRENLFVLKDYGGFKPILVPFCGSAVLDDRLYRGLKFDCLRVYSKSIDSRQAESYHAKVFVYYSSASVKNDTINSLLGIAADSNDQSQILSAINHDRVVRLNKSNEVEAIFWISGKKCVSLSTVGTVLPPEIIQDYLAKYPPTVTFTAQDLKPDTVMKAMITKRIGEIDKFDVLRHGAKPKMSKWGIPKIDAMIAECAAEMHIRCMTGMLEPGGKVICHYTEIYDNRERKSKFDELKAAAGRASLDPKHFSFNNPESIVCPFDSYLRKTTIEE